MLFETVAYYVQLLQSEDGPDLQKLFEQCDDFFIVNTALPPGPAEAQSTYLILPEGRDYKDKILAGIFDKDNDELIGVIDAIRNYPDQGVLMLGLFLLHPDHRNHGSGENLYRAFEWWCIKQGFHTMRIGVIEYNTRGVAFWQRLEFTLVEKKEPFKFGNRESAMLVMTRSISNKKSNS